MQLSWIDRLKAGDLADGIAWAAKQIPGFKERGSELAAGGKALTVGLKKGSAKGNTDDFDLALTANKIGLSASTPRGLIYGLVELARQLGADKAQNVKRRFRFKTRNYKHEINMDAVHTYTPALWERFCRDLVRLGFNGLVFYAGYHPFGSLLDYKKFPEAAELPARTRRANLKALNRGLAIAKKYGLRTFIQHYVGHFTDAFAKAHGFPFYFPKSRRLSNFDHPKVHAYNRYCYTEIVRVCPDLTGLYYNFESLGNGMEFVIANALTPYNRMKRKPVVIYRLWDMNNPVLVKKAVRFYKGETILGHKVMDTSDAYYYPRADSRVTEWKKLLPRTEFIFLMGPCHNCATNLCGGLWTDPDFIYELMDDALAKGADGLSFHSAPCLVTGNYDDRPNRLAMVNYFHVKVTSDHMQGRPLDPAALQAAYAAHFSVAPADGQKVYQAIKLSSRIILDIYRQFICNSADIGYTVPGRFTPVQEPFFFLPSTYFNHQLADNEPLHSAWLRKTRDVNVVPETVQPIIDFVDPAQKARSENPAVLAARIREAAETSRALWLSVKRNKGMAAPRKAALDFYLNVNYRFGMRIHHEIMAAIEFYSCYFRTSQPGFMAAWERGIGHLKQVPSFYRGTGEKDRVINRLLLMGPFDVRQQLETMTTVLRAVQQRGFPFDAFTAYIRSRREYNEIRRMVRPWRLYSDRTMTLIRKQLRKAVQAAEEATGLLGGRDREAFGRRVEAWLANVRSELARTTLPVAVCGDVRERRLYYDQCFRYGMFYWDDFAGFMRLYRYDAEDDIRFSIARDRSALIITVDEHSCDMASRRKWYADWKGADDQAGFIRIFIDPENKGRGFKNYCVFPLGTAVVRYNLLIKSRQETIRDLRRMEPRITTTFDDHSHGWRMQVRIPFRVIGRTPLKGETWGFNMAANTAIASLRALVWSASYEMGAGHPERMGKLEF